MARERIRLYRGTTELTYSEATMVKSNDYVVNSGKMTFRKDTNVTNGTTIDWKKVDGSTTIFSPRVENVEEGVTWTANLFTNGYELMNLPIEQVYENKTPEYIVQDVIDNYTQNLTYASASTSGVTITKYIAKGYLIDVVKDMMDALQWQLRIDENDNVYFEPKGETNNGKIFINGSNINITKWSSDPTNMINRLKVKGSLVSIKVVQDTGTGDASTTEFTLSHKPVGNVKVTVDSVEQVPTPTGGVYSVDAEQKKIVFETAPGNLLDLTFDYSYHIPVVVDDQNDVSINKYQEKFKELSVPFLDNFPDARRYAQSVLDVYSNPLIKAAGYHPQLDFDREVGETVLIKDPIRGKADVSLVISKITYNAGTNQTIYEFGSRTIIFGDWQREVQDRIKKLESLTKDEDEVAFTRLYKHSLKVNLSIDYTWRQASPVDSFVLGHNTLSRLRPHLAFEADCSDNQNHGLWHGTGTTTGSHYDTDGWRLSTGKLNGTNGYCEVTDDNTLDLTGSMSITLTVKADSLPGATKYLFHKWDETNGYGIRIASDNQVEFFYESGGSLTTFKTSSTLTQSVFQHVAFTKNGTSVKAYVNGALATSTTGGTTIGTNSVNPQVGKYDTTYFTGYIDEVQVFNDELTATEVSNIYNKIEHTSSCVLYLSMDNPRLGDRFTTPAYIGVQTKREIIKSDAVIETA